MKRIIGGYIVAFVIGVVIVVNVNLKSQRNNDLSVLSLANIETLATAEREATCTFNSVSKNQSTNTLSCTGNGTLCCIMD